MNIVSAAVIYAVITALLFRNLLPDLLTHLYSYIGDPLLNTAILAWNARHLPLSETWWNFPSFAPLTGVTVFTEHLLLTYPLASPVIWLTGNAVLAYNLVFLLSFPLNGAAVYALAHALTGRRVAAFIAGLAFAFTPYQAVHLSHLQMMPAFGMPLTLLGLHRYAEQGKTSALALVAAGWLMTALANAYLLVFFPIVIGFWFLWFGARAEPRRLVAAALAIAAATVPVVPLLWGYWARQSTLGVVRTYVETRDYSADIEGLLQVSFRHVAWRGLLPGTYDEDSLFPGLAIVALALIGLWAGFKRGVRRDPVLFYGVALAALWLLALGPEPALGDWRAPVYGPYRLLMALPGGLSIRTPARAWSAGVLCLAVLAGYGAAELIERYRARVRALVGVAALLIVAEGWVFDTTVRAPDAMRAGAVPEGAIVMDLPFEGNFWDAIPQYRAVLGGYRIINGYSGYQPPHLESVRHAIAEQRPDTFDQYRRVADVYVIVRSQVPGTVRQWIASQPGAEGVFETPEWVLYRLPTTKGD